MEIQNLLANVDWINKPVLITNYRAFPYLAFSTDEKHKFHIEKIYFNLLGINMNNQLSNLHKKVEELSEEKRNLSNSSYLKKLKYNDDLKKRDNKLNVYENQLL